MTEETRQTWAAEGAASGLAPPLSSPPADEDMGLKAPVSIGILVIALFFGVFGGWAALAPLESAAIAQGVVSVETKRKTIQ